MKMINECLDMTEAKRAALEAFDCRDHELKSMIKEKEDHFGSPYGNRHQRRLAAKRARQQA